MPEGLTLSKPILCSHLLVKMGAVTSIKEREDRDGQLDGRVFNKPRSYVFTDEDFFGVKVPSPLGNLGFQDLPYDRRGNPLTDERFNLIGHGFANVVEDLRVLAKRAINHGDVDVEDITRDLIESCPDEKKLQDYIQNPHNKKSVRREVEAYLDSLQDKALPMEKLAEKWATQNA